MTNQDGAVLNPEVPMSDPAVEGSSTENATETLRNQPAGGNETDDIGFKPVDKAVVAADDSSITDAIAAFRNQLAGGGETMVDKNGTFLNPADPMSASSLANGDGFKHVDLLNEPWFIPNWVNLDATILSSENSDDFQKEERMEFYKKLKEQVIECPQYFRHCKFNGGAMVG